MGISSEPSSRSGESTTEAFTVDEAGTYQVICAISSHFDAGMEGTLTVE
ncbi:MAG: plastocyanin/azurin family copper-binding protein [Acidimicrobiia bacterium]